EEVAAKTPEKIHRLAVDPRYGLLAHQALGLALKLYRDMAQARAAADIMQRLYAACYAVGASLAEINPLVTTRDGAAAALDASVRAILFNIFGGITRCDDVANGIVQATSAFSLKVPLVIRLTGTNEELAVQILTQAGFPALTDMDEAVKQAVAKAKAAA